MPLWNQRYATASSVAIVAAAASAAQATASAAVPADAYPSTSGNATILTMRPWGGGTATLAGAQNLKDVWRVTKTHLHAAVTVAGLGIVLTNSATGGTATLIFGIFALGSDGRPAARQADWAALGSIDVTQAPGTVFLATPGLVVPAGEWAIGCAWTGTATTGPGMTGHSGVAAATDSLAGVNTGYRMSSSGAAVPNPFVPEASTVAGHVVLGLIP